MKPGIKRIILVALAIVVGLPLALILTAQAYFSFADRTNGSIVSSGLTRRYLLYVPKVYDRSKPAALVISLHPAATWPAVERSLSRWNDLADAQGFIVVYPAGTGAFFGGLGPGPKVFPMDEESLASDVKFISELIDKLEAEYNIDPQHIYTDGMSNGGGMAFELSCKLPDRIAAVGLVAAAHQPPWDCGNSEPVPTVAFHGTADKFAPYQGGPSPIAPRPFANIPEWTAQTAQRNHCTGNPVEVRISASVRRLAYTNCADNSDVILYTIEGGGHTWPGATPMTEWWAGRTTNEIDATRIMWEFYAQHPRPGK